MWKNFVRPILAHFSPSFLIIVAQFFPYFFFGHQVQNLYPLGGGYDRGRGEQNLIRHVDGWSGSILCCLLGCCVSFSSLHVCMFACACPPRTGQDRGDLFSQSQAHIPLKPLPPCSRPLPRSACCSACGSACCPASCSACSACSACCKACCKAWCEACCPPVLAACNVALFVPCSAGFR